MSQEAREGDVTNAHGWTACNMKPGRQRDALSYNIFNNIRKEEHKCQYQSHISRLF